MTRKTKSTEPKLNVPPFQASIKGLDEHGLDIIMTVTAHDADAFCLNLAAAYTVMPLHPFGTQAPAKVTDAPKCPKCGKPCYDNRERRGANDKRPLLKCQDQAGCKWILWQAPRTDAEIADAALWKGESK